MQLAVVLGYMLVLVFAGIWASGRAKRSAEDYFLASRSLGPAVTVFTLAATNFSAFTVFGFSGQGWSTGYAFYPVMAFGTGFMALAFYIVGRPVYRLGREQSLLTPPELIQRRFRSRPLSLLVLLTMVAFTLPYLAMQPMAAGYVLENLLGIPYRLGATAVVLVLLAYMLKGGMRGVVITDVLQGGAMLVLLLTALFVVAGRAGGLSAAGSAAASSFPGLFTAKGVYAPGVLLGYIALWFWADPMFPQLFQRFYAAGSERSLGFSMSLYPVITGVLFLLPVALGVLSRLWLPELPPDSSDQVLPMLLSRACPGVLEALVLTAGLAALMSTLDSQLLTLSSMLARDLVEPLTGRRAPWWTGKIIVLALGAAGLALSFDPPATFLALATQAFTGLAVLFPVYIAALYWGGATAAGGVSAVLAGLAVTLLHHLGVLRFPGVLPVVPAVAASTAALVLVSLLGGRRTKSLTRWRSGSMPLRWTLLFSLFVLLGSGLLLRWVPDTLVLGMPWWVWGCLALCILLGLAFSRFVRKVWQPED